MKADKQRWEEDGGGEEKGTFPFRLLSETFVFGVCNFFEGTLNKEGRRVIDLAAEETPKRQTWSAGQVFTYLV